MFTAIRFEIPKNSFIHFEFSNDLYSMGRKSGPFLQLIEFSPCFSTVRINR